MAIKHQFIVDLFIPISQQQQGLKLINVTNQKLNKEQDMAYRSLKKKELKSLKEKSV